MHLTTLLLASLAVLSSGAPLHRRDQPFKGALNQLGKGAKDALKGATKDLGKGAKNLGSGFKDGLENLGDGFKDLTDNFKDALGDLDLDGLLNGR